jgi:polar amino acid transport system substrate-binding protein
MKKNNLMTLFAACIFTALIAGPSLATTLTVRADNWPPFNGDPKATKPGYMIEVLKAIFEPQGIQVDYQLMPWNRSKDEVRKGKYDAIIGTDKEEAAGFVFPKETFGKFTNAFFVLSTNNWRYAGIDSLKSVRLGIIEGYEYAENINAYVKSAPQGKVIAATGDDALPKLLKMLQAGRIDTILEDASVVATALRNVGIPANQLTMAGISSNAHDLEIAFSPAKESSRKYSEMFTAGLNELRKNGKLKQILDRYEVKDWK